MGTVYLDNGGWSLKMGVLDSKNGVAWGNFSDAAVHPSGFGSITVWTSSNYNDTTQMYAAGYVEGALSQVRIYQHLTNMHDWALKSVGVSPGGEMPSKYVEWFATNDAWVRQNVASNSSELWAHVGLVWSQFDGLVAGYNAVAPAGYNMSAYRFLETNSVGDLLDLVPALSPDRWPDWGSMNDTEMAEAIATRGHCTGIVKVTGNFSDLMAAHSSWFTYSSMLRVAKHYDFRGLHIASAKGRKTTFSSYPGMLSSLDDFYLNTESNLVMVQTTNGIMNKDLYKQVVPQSLLAWLRVRVANDKAATGAEWCGVIDSYNSGTYNNQYMVVDYSLFEAGQGLSPGLLTVCEQIPGLVVTGDVTQQLERGYWASYNVPYWPEIYNRSGYPEFIAEHRQHAPTAVTGVSYQLAPRAKIFRRDVGNVVDLPSLKTFMRSNGYPTDPYFLDKPSPFDAICSRGDLMGYLGGCYDSKVVNAEWVALEKAEMINGPTRAGGAFKPFRWTPEMNSTAHMGMPAEFDFEFEEMIPGWAL